MHHLALTIRQPWAALVARGEKLYETRSWKPQIPLIGQRLAVHAAKQRLPRYLSPEKIEAIERGLGLSQPEWSQLPLGAVICTVRLAGAYQIEVSDPALRHLITDLAVEGSPSIKRVALTSDAWQYGDYSPGRWLWDFDTIDILVPRAAIGRRKIWRWHCTDIEVAEKSRRQTIGTSAIA